METCAKRYSESDAVDSAEAGEPTGGQKAYGAPAHPIAEADTPFPMSGHEVHPDHGEGTELGSRRARSAHGLAIFSVSVAVDGKTEECLLHNNNTSNNNQNITSTNYTQQNRST